MVTAGLRRVLAQLAPSGKLGRHLSSVMGLDACASGM